MTRFTKTVSRKLIFFLKSDLKYSSIMNFKKVCHAVQTRQNDARLFYVSRSLYHCEPQYWGFDGNSTIRAKRKTIDLKPFHSLSRLWKLEEKIYHIFSKCSTDQRVFWLSHIDWL